MRPAAPTPSAAPRERGPASRSQSIPSVGNRIDGLDGLRRRTGIELHCPAGAMDASRRSSRWPRGHLCLGLGIREASGFDWARSGEGNCSGAPQRSILPVFGPQPAGRLRDERDSGGVSTLKIRQQTGHASDAKLSRYIRDGELFLGNAAGTLL